MSVHQQKTVRFTLDMPPDMHRHLKIICAEDMVSMHDFVTQAIKEKFETREEKLDALAYDEGIKEISEGKGIDFDTAMREIGL